MNFVQNFKHTYLTQIAPKSDPDINLGYKKVILNANADDNLTKTTSRNYLQNHIYVESMKIYLEISIMLAIILVSIL